MAEFTGFSDNQHVGSGTLTTGCEIAERESPQGNGQAREFCFLEHFFACKL